MKKIIAICLLVFSTSLVFGQANGLVISNKASGGAIGTAAATVDVASLFNVNQTTASQTLTVPNLTNTTNGKTIHVNNVGSTAFTLLSKTIEPGTGILLRWIGSAWSISGVGNASGGGGAADSSIFATQYDITFKVDKSNNLSDLPSSSTARTNLGLGNSATRNVGTTTGTVAAGDDSRFNVADANTLTGNTLASNVTASSLTSVGTLTDLTVTATIVGSESTGSSTTINTNVPYNERTLTANTTFTFSNTGNSKTWIVVVKNISTAYTVTWPAGIKWGTNGAPTQRANTGDDGDVYTFFQENGFIYGAARQ